MIIVELGELREANGTLKTNISLYGAFRNWFKNWKYSSKSW